MEVFIIEKGRTLFMYNVEEGMSLTSFYRERMRSKDRGEKGTLTRGPLRW